MKIRRLTWTATAAVIALLLLVLAGCTTDVEDADDGPVTIRILSNAKTAKTGVDNLYGMSYEIERLIEEYGAGHENVTVEIEYLPESGEERETRMEQLRTEILAGRGPDIYLMSPYEWKQTGYNTYATVLVKGLFPNVEQSMHNGLFYDVSSFYDADGELNTQELAAGVMDAGVVNGARYMLPLRYTYPVIYANKEVLEESGADLETMKSDLNGFINELVEHGDTSWFNGAAGIAYSDPLPLFPHLLDYENGTVLLTPEELTEFIRQCWKLNEGCDRIGSMGNVAAYMTMGWFTIAIPEEGEDPWATMRAPLCYGEFTDAVHAAAMAQVEGVELEMFPLRSWDGSLVAKITWWGAVGSGCEHPEEAYDFLRLLLLPESQWELERPTGTKTFVSGLVGRGWPVRSIGSVEPLWNRLAAQLDSQGADSREAVVRRKSLQEITLTDGDILPLLTARVDAARVPMATSSDWTRVLSYPAEYADNLDAVVRELIEELRYHLAEG